MPLARWALLLLGVAGTALSSPVSSSSAAAAAAATEIYALKDAHPVPRLWTAVGDAPGDHVLKLEIALKQSRFDELDRQLMEVSDPDHERCGDHLSAAAVEELVRPSSETSALVHEWLGAHGIGREALSYTPAGDWISVSLPVRAVEELLQTKYSVYLHEDGSYAVRAPQWSLPAALHAHIDTIQPTNSFFRPTPRKRLVETVQSLGAPKELPALPPPLNNPSVSAVCNSSAITPTCLRTLYGTLDYKPQVPGKNKVGLTDYLGESNNRSDTKIFLENYRPDAVSAAYQFKVVVINGGNNQQTPENATELAAGKDLEGNLDVETLLGLDYPTPLVAFTTGGSPPFKPDDTTPTNTNEPYAIWLNYVLKQTDLPQTISTSYADDEQTVPYAYAKRVCEGFAQLGARGVSLFFGSGDAGVGASGQCVSNDGKNTSTFLADFPASCPYVTTVGATTGFNPEVAAYDPRNAFSSGGGFSRYFARPSYQDAAVLPYLKSLGDKYKGLYNTSGRAYPDVSAQGQTFATIWNGTIVGLDGTSASTPTVAGVISLVNDALLAAGKKPLGFLNPWLYKTGYKGFTDVTSGSTRGCNVTGFPAVKGWDAVTGWGTPYFPKIKALALGM